MISTQSREKIMQQIKISKFHALPREIPLKIQCHALNAIFKFHKSTGAIK